MQLGTLGMTLTELKQMVDRAYERAAKGHRNPDSVTVYIPTFKVGAVGHIPVTGVKSVHMGFDWEANSCLITPETSLREIDRDEIKTLREKYDDLSWKLSDIDRLKRENKRLKEQIDNHPTP